MANELVVGPRLIPKRLPLERWTEWYLEEDGLEVFILGMADELVYRLRHAGNIEDVLERSIELSYGEVVEDGEG